MATGARKIAERVRREMPEGERLRYLLTLYSGCSSGNEKWNIRIAVPDRKRERMVTAGSLWNPICLPTSSQPFCSMSISLFCVAFPKVFMVFFLKKKLFCPLCFHPLIDINAYCDILNQNLSILCGLCFEVGITPCVYALINRSHTLDFDFWP